MKNLLPFVLSGFDSLAGKLRVGLIGYSTDFKQVGGITTLHLFLVTGEIVKIYSQMHDLGNWDEIGTLVFEVVETPPKVKMIHLSEEWRGIRFAEKLVFDRLDFVAECGIALRSEGTEVFLVVTSANVDTLAIQAPYFGGEFLPENDLSSYQYVAVG